MEAAKVLVAVFYKKKFKSNYLQNSTFLKGQLQLQRGKRGWVNNLKLPNRGQKIVCFFVFFFWGGGEEGVATFMSTTYLEFLGRFGPKDAHHPAPSGNWGKKKKNQHWSMY